MSNIIYTKALCAAAAIAITATGFSASVNAQGRITRTATVDYTDLDLTSEAGQATLNGRLKVAVRKVCGSVNRKNLTDVLDHGACLQEANASAQRASVTIMAAAKAGKPVKTALVISN